jgi:hypothetical protein
MASPRPTLPVPVGLLRRGSCMRIGVVPLELSSGRVQPLDKHLRMENVRPSILGMQYIEISGCSFDRVLGMHNLTISGCYYRSRDLGHRAKG